MERVKRHKKNQNYQQSAAALIGRVTALFASTKYFPKSSEPPRTGKRYLAGGQGATADRQPRLFPCHFLPGPVGLYRCRSPPPPFRLRELKNRNGGKENV